MSPPSPLLAGVPPEPLRPLADRLEAAGHALMTIESTEAPWLPGHLEPLLSKVWYPTTVATRLFSLRKALNALATRTGSPAENLFQVHDFGYRRQRSIRSCAGYCSKPRNASAQKETPMFRRPSIAVQSRLRSARLPAPRGARWQVTTWAGCCASTGRRGASACASARPRSARRPRPSAASSAGTIPTSRRGCVSNWPTPQRNRSQRRESVMNCSVSWCVSVATDGECCPVHQKYPVHHSGETFSAAVRAQMQRWRENEVEINKVLARLQTADMVIGPSRRGGWSTGTAQVRG